jgi:plasmid rolling circle replication initiator protein Rep
MCNNNSINTPTNQELEILSDKDKKGKERPWKENKEKTMSLAESYKRLGMKKSYRVAECGTYLEFKKFPSNEKKLAKANFCKVRLCPMCSWRRSRKIYGQVSQVMDYALKDKEYRFLFLTLTCKNVDGERLSETIDNLFHAYKKMSERKQFKKSVKGWFRGLEVTHNLDEASKDYDTYHPHFHVILMVNKSYFNDRKQYIKQEDWTNLWKDCLGVDYTPIVNVKAFKTANKAQTSKSVAESAKYTVKDNDYLITDNEELTDNAVMILDSALAGRRLIAFGGELRKIHRLLNLDDAENGDLIHTDNEELREDLNYVIERYQWHIGYHQYIKAE